MKSTIAIMTILALSGVQGIAKTLQFPDKGGAMFSITIPDDWEPEKDEDNILEATSPDEHVYISAWELEDKEDLKALGKDIKDLLKDHAKDIKIVGEPQEARPGGMDGLLFKGTAKSEEDDKDIEFFALLIVAKEKAAVLFIEADADTPKEEAAKLEGILKSITPPGGAKKVLRAALAVDKDTKPTDTFSADVPKIYAFFIGEALKAGDKVRGVWIADDVGTVAPKGTKIDEATVTAETPTDQSAFSLSKPTAGWPIGKYHVDIFVNDTLVETVPFSIKEK